MQKVLVTGSAGFIGFHTSLKLTQMGFDVLGLDNINTYYDIDLKLNRLKELGINSSNIIENLELRSEKFKNFRFIKTELSEKHQVDNIINDFNPDYVIHLAAQAGVRYSLEKPEKYIESNITGFFNLIDAIKQTGLRHFIFASSSSVYGLNKSIPFKSSDSTDHPISIYAATKKSNEVMAHSYSHLYDIPVTGLRFFTVYGPWGRPDMALFKFTKSILNGKKINVYNNGEMSRDFTYIDDIVESITRLLDIVPEPIKQEKNSNLPSNNSSAPYIVYNIGHNVPVKLMSFISAIEKCTSKKAKINLMPIQPGDVKDTYADVEDLFERIDYKPKMGIEEGVENFVDWFRFYHKI